MCSEVRISISSVATGHGLVFLLAAMAVAVKTVVISSWWPDSTSRKLLLEMIKG